MLTFYKRFLNYLLFLIFLTSVTFGQAHPNLSAPVNGSTWETASPTLYWWYLPTPYVAGPYDYSVQVSAVNDFSQANLLVDAVVTTNYGAGNYTVSNSVGLMQGVVYYWRVGINGNYSDVWHFSPYTSGNVVTYSLTAIAESNGSISPSGTITVVRGSSRTFTIVPNAGYSIKDVFVDDVSVGAVSTYKFENITAGHTIRATFLLIPVFETTYVSMLGSDSDGDGSQAKPYRTIQRGVDKSKPGQFVHVLNGTYAQDVVITKPIKIIGEVNPSTRSFLIRANDVTIKNFNVTQSSPGPGIQKVGLESYNHLDKLTLENVNAYNNAELGLLLINIDSVEVKNCNFYGNDMGGISVINCKHLLFENIGLEDNLRGFAAYNSNYIAIDHLYSKDNGKAYLALFPDKNGMTFSICNNLSLNEVTSINNQEQGIKFEDCSDISMNGVSANNNGTDGIAFIESDHITYITGTASKNGTTVNDNGIEIVGCENINFTTVSANENFNTGINFKLYYQGVYKWDPKTNIPAPLPNVYYGPTTNVSFTDVSACTNGYDGFYAMHLSYADITNPNFSDNVHAGFELDAAHHINLIDGTYDLNDYGIILRPTENFHPVEPKLSTDEITTFSLTGTASISDNTYNGISIKPLGNTKVTEPLFYGKLNLFENGNCGVEIAGQVTDPIFSGLYLKSNPSLGFYIDDLPGLNVTGVKINDCIFQGYGPLAGQDAISLRGISAGNVDARNNVFVGADLAAINAMIFDKFDNAACGYIDITGWTNGQPAIKIGSASAYTGSLVRIPVELDKSASALSITQLMGKITFDEHKLRFKDISYGNGTLINDAGWGLIYDHSVTDELRIISFGFSPINTSGVLFTLTFEVADGNDGSAAIQGLAADWTVNGGLAPFVVKNGSISYLESQSVSIVKGDASMDFAVDSWDYMTVINHVNGITITGQAFLNADVNKDNRVDELDAADIQAFVNTGIWPGTASQALAELTFASCSLDQDGILRFPLTLYNSTNVRTVQVDLTYDDSKIDFRNFVQLMRGNDYYVEAKTIKRGTTRVLFTSSQKSNGTIVPAELFFNIKDSGIKDGLIKSTYSINGSEAKPGPDYGSSNVTEVEIEQVIPVSFDVEQNYPNPFNPSTTIKYSLPAAGPVTFKIYDIIGSLVNTLVDTEMPAGIHEVVWNGENSSGTKAASGTYFYQVKSGSRILTKKMLLLK